MDEPRLELLGVLRARRPPRTALRSDRERHRHLPARHRPVLRGLVDELLHRDREEVLVHDLDDRAHALDRGADPAADDRHLRDRRVADALGPNSSRSPCVTAIEPPISAMSSPMMNTSLVVAQRLRERVADSLAVGQLRHRRTSSASSGSGSVPAFANSTAASTSAVTSASMAANSSSPISSRAPSSSIGSLRLAHAPSARPCRGRPAGRRRNGPVRR